MRALIQTTTLQTRKQNIGGWGTRCNMGDRTLADMYVQIDCFNKEGTKGLIVQSF